MSGPTSDLDNIHHSLRATAFDLPSFARDCLLGAEVLGIQDPIGKYVRSAVCKWACVLLLLSSTLNPPFPSRLCVLTSAVGMELGRTIVADRPPSSRRRLASRPQSAVWTDDLPTHRKAPAPPSVLERKVEGDSEVKDKVGIDSRPATPGAGTRDRRASHRRSRPSYPPVSPSQRARELTSASPSPPKALVRPLSPRPPSPRPSSPPSAYSASLTHNLQSVLDRPHPNSRPHPRPRSISPPSSAIVTPTDSTFVIPFPVARPTPPTSPVAAVPPTTPKRNPASSTPHASPTPTQKAVQTATHRHSLHALTAAEDMRPAAHLLKLASSPGKKPQMEQSQFAALVLVKSNTPSIYCAGEPETEPEVLGEEHPFPHRSESREELPVPSISITAPPPSSPRFSFSALLAPASPRKTKHSTTSPLSPIDASNKLQKRRPRQRRVSAEASQWAWGAKRNSVTQPTSPS